MFALFSYANFVKNQLGSFSQNYFCSDKRENSNKPDFKPVQMFLVLLKSMDLFQFLLAKDEMQPSTTKQCLSYGLSLLSGRTCLASVTLHYFTGQTLFLVFCFHRTFYQWCGLCVQHPSECAACFWLFLAVALHDPSSRPLKEMFEQTKYLWASKTSCKRWKQPLNLENWGKLQRTYSISLNPGLCLISWYVYTRGQCEGCTNHFCVWYLTT